MALTLWLRSAKETRSLGRALGRLAVPGQVIALTGDLGAGKTTLVQALARGMGVRSDAPVRSPTFSILDEHPGRLPLYHLDFYRLEGESELEDLGLREVLGGEGVAAVEWADRFPEEIPAGALWVRLAHHPAGGRLATVDGPPGPWRQALMDLHLPEAPGEG